MSEKKNPYQVLGVQKKASKVEIRRAYRRLSLQCHPDHARSPNATARYREILEAKNVLLDDEHRAALDRRIASRIRKKRRVRKAKAPTVQAPPVVHHVHSSTMVPNVDYSSGALLRDVVKLGAFWLLARVFQELFDD